MRKGIFLNALWKKAICKIMSPYNSPTLQLTVSSAIEMLNVPGSLALDLCQVPTKTHKAYHMQCAHCAKTNFNTALQMGE